MKKFYTIFICIFLCSVLFISCGKAEVSTDIKVNKNGSTESVIKVAYDDIVKAVVKNDLLFKVVGDKYGEVKKYREDGLNIEEVKITTDKMKVTDMINTFKSIDANKVEASELNNFDDYINFSIDKNKGIIFNIYTVKINLKKDLVAEALENTKDIEEISPNLANTLNNSIGSYIGNIPYTLKLNIPFEVVDSNGKALDKNTVEWDWTLADLNPNTWMILSFKTINIISMVAAGLTIVVIFIGIVVYLKKKRK